MYSLEGIHPRQIFTIVDRDNNWKCCKGYLLQSRMLGPTFIIKKPRYSALTFWVWTSVAFECAMLHTF